MFRLLIVVVFAVVACDDRPGAEGSAGPPPRSRPEVAGELTGAVLLPNDWEAAIGLTNLSSAWIESLDADNEVSPFRLWPSQDAPDGYRRFDFRLEEAPHGRLSLTVMKDPKFTWEFDHPSQGALRLYLPPPTRVTLRAKKGATLQKAIWSIPGTSWTDSRNVEPDESGTIQFWAPRGNIRLYAWDQDARSVANGQSIDLVGESVDLELPLR